MAKRRTDTPLLRKKQTNTSQKTTKSAKSPARPTTKPGVKLTLHDRLSQLTHKQAIEILGEEGRQKLQEALTLEQFVPKRDFFLAGDLARITVRENGGQGNVASEVTATLMSGVKHKLHFNCPRCSQQDVTRTACEHIASVLLLLLEEKTLLGLADVPDLETPFEMLSRKRLTQRALHEREERAKAEKFEIVSSDKTSPWADYAVTSELTGKTYKVALRGENRGDSYCSCPDFKTNRLGTCKHILHVLHRMRRKFDEKIWNTPYLNNESFVYVRYAEDTTLHLVLADGIMNGRRKNATEVLKVAKQWLDRPIDDVRGLVKLLPKLEAIGEQVIVYPDAEELMQKRLFAQHVEDIVADIRRDPKKHPLRKELLKVELLPYQLDGIAFAAGCGRAILADDMGLGKTIQGIGVAELLRREFDIKKVLIVCPASVKSQWRNEINRFCDRSVQLVVGSAKSRFEQYDNDAFFTICNYEQVLRDFEPIEQTKWDLIILDEGQRIKNWESKTARMIKALQSPYALVLTGTPLENRIDELYSIVQFIDDRRLPPAYRFFHQHRDVDETGRVVGYKKLDTLREMIKPILLRRTRDSVLNQLPERSTEIVRIPPTEEQVTIHIGQARIVSQIIHKPYISEMDLLRLQKALLCCRMVADSTFLVDKQEPSYSTKLQHLREMIPELFAEENRKAVLFSEWTTMLDLIEPILKKEKLGYVRLDGKVPQKKRQQLVHEFQTNPECALFLTTNAGSVGLNLQAANTVINVDLPWNPAILEQRIGRAHRMGQKRPVQVFLLVTEATIEENMLTTLSTKHDLAMAALDINSEVTKVDFKSGVEELKRRLEVLLGAKKPAPVDVSQQQAVLQQIDQTRDRREKIANAGGELLGAFAKFLNELVETNAPQPDATTTVLPESNTTAAPSQLQPVSFVDQLIGSLSQCLEDDADGKPRLSITLPNREIIDTIKGTLAKFLR
ncbi:MAG: DEAD/DEAH box helicase [Planctomycetaceae bacterium]|nr:DEAD/DEAH box helicase [Planctomycetaceae bacterium]